MAATPVRIGIAGVGYWGSTLLRTFRALPPAAVTALCDGDPERRAALARSHPDLACLPTFEALLARPDVDAVLVVTPPSRHAEMATAALEAGKHVWVEKPLALTAADGRALVELAARRERVLFVDHTFLYDPMVSEMRRRIDAGDLGEVYHVSLQRLGMGRIRRDSDVWWNSAPHDLSILFRLLPRPVAAVRLHTHAYLQPGIADMAVCDLELAGGASAHIYLSWLHPEKTAKVVVVGSRAILVYEGRFQQRALTRYAYTLDRTPPAPGRIAPIIPIDVAAGEPIVVEETGEPLASAARDFVAAIQRGDEPLASGRRMLPVVEVLEAADRVATRGAAAGG